ncbi:unnamed protein product, partial [Brassica oleracea var. botrytis]
QRIAIAYFVAALCEIWFKGNHNGGGICYYNNIFILTLRLIRARLRYQISTQDQRSTTFLNLKVKCGVRGRTRL